MTTYRVTETIHHGSFRSEVSAEHEHARNAFRQVLSESPYYSHVLEDPIKEQRKVRELIGEGRTDIGWAEYTLTEV